MPESHHYRTLLPRSHPNSKDSSSDAGESSSRSRRKVVSVACTSCRSKKRGCDGKKPACTPCQTRSIECIYMPPNTYSDLVGSLRLENEALKANAKDTKELYDVLRSAPHEMSLDILRRLQSSAADIPTILSLAKADFSSTPPQQRVPVAPNQSSLEFELMIRYPIAYPAIVPLDKVPELAGNGGDWTNWSRSTRSAPSSSANHDFNTTAGSTAGTPGSFPACQYADHRLHSLRILNWTTVPISNDFAARVISCYLTTSHPLLGFFDADLFLDGLVSSGSRFCSQLLVCSLLFFACQGYTAIEARSSLVSQAFFDQAKVLWEQEKYISPMLTVSAALLLHLGCICNGDDHIGKEFILEAVVLGEQMRLFDLDMEAINLTVLLLDQTVEDIRARGHITWGLFNWQMLWSFYCHEKPMASSCPPCPIPDLASLPPSLPMAMPPNLHIGETFAAMCKLWTIMFDMMFSYYESPNPVSTRIALPFVCSIYHRLLALTQTLPVIIARGDETPAHGRTFQSILLHAAIVDLFRPFLGCEAAPHNVLSGFTSKQAGPEAAYAASIEQLKRLILVYRARHAPVGYSSFWHVALLMVYTDFMTDRAAVSAEREFYFDVCMQSYKELTVAHRMFSGLVQSLLAMALRTKAVTPSKGRKLMDEFREAAKHHGSLEGVNMAGVVYVEALPDSLPAEEGVEELSREYDELMIMDELIGL